MTEKRISIEKGFLLAAVSAIFIILCFFIVKPAEVDAASSYKAISFEDGEEKTPVKVKGYYFKYNSKGKLCISKKKSSGYKSTKITSYDAWTNGTTIYYTKNGTMIYKYTISSKKTKLVKNLFTYVIGKGEYAYITKIYKNKIYLTSFYGDEADTYYYDIKTGKTKKVKSDADILASSGKYCVCRHNVSQELLAEKLTLYKITSSGKFKKVKTLTKKGYPYVKVIDGKFYYAQYSSSTSYKKASVYRINASGKGKKKMTTITETFEIKPYRFSKKSCKFLNMYNDVYKYTY